MSSRSEKPKSRKTTSDPYSILINDNWELIEKAFKEHEQIGPVIILDVTDSKIYAYKGAEFLETLSVRTRQETKDVFVKIKTNGGMMVFVRDSINRKLHSYVFTKRQRGE